MKFISITLALLVPFVRPLPDAFPANFKLSSFSCDDLALNCDYFYGTDFNVYGIPNSDSSGSGAVIVNMIPKAHNKWNPLTVDVKFTDPTSWNGAFNVMGRQGFSFDLLIRATGKDCGTKQSTFDFPFHVKALEPGIKTTEPIILKAKGSPTCEIQLNYETMKDTQITKNMKIAAGGGGQQPFDLGATGGQPFDFGSLLGGGGGGGGGKPFDFDFGSSDKKDEKDKSTEQTISNNVVTVIFIGLAVIAFVGIVFGTVVHYKNKKQSIRNKKISDLLKQSEKTPLLN